VLGEFVAQSALHRGANSAVWPAETRGARTAGV